MTIEDPIEFLHRHKSCIVNQRELGTDAQSFGKALKAALRQDPDVILVGEMRDLETMQTALTAAETGHLVFATLHTQDTAQTVDRIVDSFPPEQQHQVRSQLAIALQGIVTQQLLPTADGQGRICACEVLVPTPAVRNLIREGKTHQIYSALQTGGAHGMQTMDAALADLVRRQKITPRAGRVALDRPRGAPPPDGHGAGRLVRCPPTSSPPSPSRRSTSSGVSTRGEVEAEYKQHVASQLRAKGLIVIDIEREEGLRRRRRHHGALQARQGAGAHGRHASALDDDLVGHVAAALALRARGAGRERQAQGSAVAGAQGRRGRHLVRRGARPPPQDLQRPVRRDGRRRRDRRHPGGDAPPRRRPAREGRLAAPPGQGRDDVPGADRRLRR